MLTRDTGFPWLRTAIVLALSFGCPLTAAATPVSPAGFVIENAWPGVRFILPTAVAFLPDGRALVAEKRGVVWVIDHGALRPTPMWSAEREVLANGDRGLIGLAVDPKFTTNHRLYFFYTADPDSNGNDDNVGAFSRLTRYQTSAADSNVVDPASRTVLIGRSWSDGFLSPTLSHAVDCLAFGSDGSLLVTHGDGSHFDIPDVGGHDPESFLPGRGDPAADLGSFRAQYLNTLSGKLLRINPETGAGYASNPYAAGDLMAPRARVWAYGFRNPFRFCVRPGTGSADTAAANPGTVYVGDVGANRWEELDVADHPGMNFGWPCREGPEVYTPYASMAPPGMGCDAMNSSGNPALPTAPRFTWNHDDSTLSAPFGIRGNCTAGGTFYTGARYPAAFRGRLFFGDYGGGWLKVATLDSANAITSMQSFAGALDGPVDFAMDPVSQEVFYASIYANEIRRIRYTGETSELPPVAIASGVPVTLAAGDTVKFSSLGSYDPGGDAVSFAWSFGDGTPGSSEAHPAHRYLAPGAFAAILSVSGELGAITRDTVQVVVTATPGFPVTPVLDAFQRPDAPLAGPQWVGNLTGLAVKRAALMETATSNYAMWNAPFGANQEVYVTLDSIALNAPEHDLLLGVQGTTWTAGAIQVVYDATNSVIAISTYSPAQGWKHIAGPWRGVQFTPGDRFGARLYSNGVLEVFRNNTVIDRCRVDTWTFAGHGGRIGLMLSGAAGSRLSGFGGGDVPLRNNAPPEATILSPADHSFFAAGDQVVLRGRGTDAEDPADSLKYRWEVSIRHNNHLHPDVLTRFAAVDSFTAENHDDGTGISLIVKLIVTDRAGEPDTASIEIHPEIDLVPARITLAPDDAFAGPFTCSFTIVNRGRMPAPRSRWQLSAGGVTVAQGDTTVPASDSVRVTRVLPAVAPGAPTLTLEVDALHEVLETTETNNVLVRPIAPRPFPTARLLDTFERADSALGAPWLGTQAGFAVRNQALMPLASTAYAIWNGAVFGPEHEVYVRFDSVTADAPEHCLLLASQGTSWSRGVIEVSYAAATGVLSVYTYSPTTGWTRRGGPWNARFVAGDQFGARVTATGAVTAYRNGVAIGTATVTGWEFAGRGGRIGLLLHGAARTRLVDFGGGDAIAGPATAPHAAIAYPANGSIQPAGELLALAGSGTDAEDAVQDLRMRWRVTLPGGTVAVAGASSGVVLPSPLAVPVPVQLVVTDRTGRTDTARVVVRAGAPALDRFDRPDGAPGAAWSGNAAAFAIRGRALVETASSGYMTWAAAFGPDQEAWMQLDSLTATTPDLTLLLGSQGPSWSAGVIQVVYSPQQSLVQVNTYAPGTGWIRRGGPWRNIAFASGDRMTARAWRDGRVQVFRNGAELGTAAAGGWPWVGAGGRIGLLVAGATRVRITRFGGGTLAPEFFAGAPPAEVARAGAAVVGDAIPGRVWVSRAIPNPVTRDAAFALELPREAIVGIAVFDLAGRILWSEPGVVHGAGRTWLHWQGYDSRGIAAKTGMYVARVSVDGESFLRRFTVLK